MKKILLTEDDDFLIDIYSTKLKKEGFIVEIAKTGKECLEKLEKDSYHLLLLDLILPEIDGWQVLEEIKKKREKGEKNFKDLKIVVLSNVQEKEIFSGVDAHLIKSENTPSQVAKRIIELLK
jgi:two-component system alkaline phosphatase synthesis response regulator PhoP